MFLQYISALMLWIKFWDVNSNLTTTFPVAAARLWNSLSSHITAVLPRSPSSGVVLYHISSHLLIPLCDSSLICTVPAQ